MRAKGDLKMPPLTGFLPAAYASSVAGIVFPAKANGLGRRLADWRHCGRRKEMRKPQNRRVERHIQAPLARRRIFCPGNAPINRFLTNG